jgi:hypothetical protein
LGYIAAIGVQAILGLGLLAVAIFCYRNRNRFDGSEKPKPGVKVTKQEIEFYLKYAEWVLIVLAFTSAIQLTNRNKICSWDDKAGCLPLSTPDIVGGVMKGGDRACLPLLTIFFTNF